MIPRRRFLAISAAALCAPAHATSPVRWRGRAMGAEVSLTLEGPEDLARRAVARITETLRRCESLFSLYDPASTLSRLNRDKRLPSPPSEFLDLLHLCARMHRATAGRFDPTVQPLWQALAGGGDAETARRAIGWGRVALSPHEIAIGPDQALTLNGIAQGYATDLVACVLRDAGLPLILVNIGEFHAGGRPWRLGISDPHHGLVATERLEDLAIATSSPSAMTLPGGNPHILDPTGDGAPRWSTVSVVAENAATADALSTAFCHATEDEIRSLRRADKNLRRVICVAPDGTLARIDAHT